MLPLIITLLVSASAPTTVLDYFLLLPASAGFEEDAKARVSSIATRDLAHGYLAGTHEGAEAGWEVALFSRKDDAPVIAVNNLAYGPAATSRLSFFTYDNKSQQWSDVTAKVVPYALCSRDAIAKVKKRVSSRPDVADLEWDLPDGECPWFYVLPRLGTVIEARLWTGKGPSEGPKLFELVWTRGSFSVR
jgi:hypothetical protein